jgi:hypothetical protein
MKDGKGQERTEINIIKIISHADEGVERDGRIERNWNNRNNRLAQLGYLITKIILIILISVK